jgi:2-polyprenyl-6-methoxyphenol hydroxylase-like FAD-dependent oxidoreductase
MGSAVQCCIAGGGPAGMMLGLLLARAGVRVLVLEKHRDFLRDFRGDTIHPSTMELLHELGLLEAFLRLPHQEVREIRAQIGETSLPVADFSRLPVRCPFIAMIPQWDFLAFLAQHAARYPGFALRMQTEVTGLTVENDRVVGVECGTERIRSDLVVGADGRHSLVRNRAGLPLVDLGAPIDVLWFRLSRQAADPQATMGRFDRGSAAVMLNRGDYWQCAFVIGKGSLALLHERGLEALRARIAGALGFPAGRMRELASWGDVKLLTVQVNRLAQWARAGLLCIGDAAHAMSPIGGVGINLAIQDAVAAANRLHGEFRSGAPSLATLAQVQRRRGFPTRVTQRLQVLVQKRILQRVLEDDESGGPFRPPLAARLLGRFALLRRIPARMIGMGARPEHIESPAASPPIAA